MAIERKQVTVYRCDKCGLISKDELGQAGFSSTVVIDIAMKMYDGATGGQNRRLWLCGPCTGKLEQFLSQR